MTSTPSDAETGTALATEGVRAGVTMLELRYGLEDKPGPLAALLFGLQHVLVMFTAMIACASSVICCCWRLRWG